MGTVHFFDASWLAGYTNFGALPASGYGLRLRVNFRITLLTLSITLVVSIALPGGRLPARVASVGPRRWR
jgi:hypothetical protein